MMFRAPFRSRRQTSISISTRHSSNTNINNNNNNRTSWPSPYILLKGPGLILQGPKLLLRAPAAAKRRTQRLFSTTRSRLTRRQNNLHQTNERFNPSSNTTKSYSTSSSSSSSKDYSNPHRPSFTARLKKRLSETPTVWYPIPISLGIAVLVVVNFYKGRSWESKPEPERKPDSVNHVTVQGPWQVHVLGALPLRSISRLYGTLNSYTLPVWCRTPGYKLWSVLFGVNLDECEPSDLKEYQSMSQFFMRKLKPGVRPIADAALVSPADGKVVNFGTVVDGRVQQVKGKTYSLEALLSGTGQINTTALPFTQGNAVDEHEFANVNGITYSLGDLIGNADGSKATDASLSEAELLAQADGPERSVIHDASVALAVVPASMPWAAKGAPKAGNKMFFAVVYLAPGDYHRFHSPTSWVVERRRHFAGELFSVSPWMANKLADLFVLNERVALLGRWRHGFFSMVPVGATNVGSIRINFDSTLRTNTPAMPITPGTFSEATYAKASALLGGQPLRAGDEVGGFWLGSTIVMVFEAPEDFKFTCKTGDLVKVGEVLGDVGFVEQEKKIE